MPKISLDNLERYDGHLKDWCDARFAERKVHENWHEAGPSGAVSFYPESNRPIDPVVNFAFTETLPEGTKGPDNPSTITGVSSITVTRCETVGTDSTDYTISLGDTYYGGSVDLSAGTMTVTRYGMVLDGTEAWFNFRESAASGIYRMQLAGLPLPKLNQSTHCVFTHYIYNSSDSEAGPHAVVYVDGNLVLWDTYTTIDAFKAFLAEQYANGTPLKATYNLLTQYTVQLTPTQIYSLSQPDPYTPRINTIYSDQQSILVKYPKSPIVSGSELDDAILSLGGD